MKVISQLEEFDPSNRPLSLTIGNFDGVHLGHQAVLSHLKGEKAVFTFSNHPLEVLSSTPFESLVTTSHRLRLFASYGVETTLLIPFTEVFSKQTPEAFLKHLRSYVPFTHLVLGYDAVLGYARQGNAAHLRALAEKQGFSLEYLKPVLYENEPVSSSAIRSYIQEGNLKRASALLGRPYSIVTRVEPGERRGRLLGFETANLRVENLCLPPLGVYVVQMEIEGTRYWGVANLGKAPTFHANRSPILEVHLLNFKGNLYHQEGEVVFLKYLREEKKFPSIEALQSQIREDVHSALAYSEKAGDELE